MISIIIRLDIKSDDHLNYFLGVIQIIKTIIELKIHEIYERYSHLFV